MRTLGIFAILAATAAPAVADTSTISISIPQEAPTIAELSSDERDGLFAELSSDERDGLFAELSSDERDGLFAELSSDERDGLFA